MKRNEINLRHLFDPEKGDFILLKSETPCMICHHNFNQLPRVWNMLSHALYSSLHFHPVLYSYAAFGFKVGTHQGTHGGKSPRD